MSKSLYEDELLFLAHSVALEQEAADRLYELADAMEVHNNRSLKNLFLELADFSERHAEDVERHCKGKPLPLLKAWEYSWPEEESPELFYYSQVHYMMTAQQALQVALEVEQSALRFYQNVAENTGNAAIKVLAESFAQEEADHVRAVTSRLQALQNEDAPLDDTDFDPPNMPE